MGWGFFLLYILSLSVAFIMLILSRQLIFDLFIPSTCSYWAASKSAWCRQLQRWCAAL